MSTEHSLTQVTQGYKTPWADRTEKMAKFPQVMLHMHPASKITRLWHATSFPAAVPASTLVYELVAPKQSQALYCTWGSVHSGQNTAFTLGGRCQTQRFRCSPSCMPHHSPWHTLFSFTPGRAPLTSPSVWIASRARKIFPNPRRHLSRIKLLLQFGGKLIIYYVSVL